MAPLDLFELDHSIGGLRATAVGGGGTGRRLAVDSDFGFEATTTGDSGPDVDHFGNVSDPSAAPSLAFRATFF